MDISLKSLLFFLPSVSTHFFPPLCEMLNVGQGKLLSEASKLFMHAVFQLAVVHKMAFSKSTFRRLKRWKSENATSGM